MVTVAAWLFVLVVGGSLFMLLIGNPLIDWLDARTSRLTPEQATRRAKLAAIGQWPPVYRPWRRPIEWVLLLVGITIILLASSAYRYWSR